MVVQAAQCITGNPFNSTEVRIARLLDDLRAHLEMVEDLHESMRRAVDRSAEEAARPDLQPAPLEVLNAIHVSRYDADALKSLRQTAQCVICCADWEAGEELARLPGCGHLFHPACVREWLGHAANCPICRCDLVEAVHAVGDDHSLAASLSAPATPTRTPSSLLPDDEPGVPERPPAAAAPSVPAPPGPPSPAPLRHCGSSSPDSLARSPMATTTAPSSPPASSTSSSSRAAGSAPTTPAARRVLEARASPAAHAGVSRRPVGTPGQRHSPASVLVGAGSSTLPAAPPGGILSPPRTPAGRGTAGHQPPGVAPLLGSAGARRPPSAELPSQELHSAVRLAATNRLSRNR